MTGHEVIEIFATALALSTMAIAGVVVAIYAVRAARKAVRTLRRQRKRANWHREFGHGARTT